MNIIKEICWERTNLIFKFDEIDKEAEYYIENSKNEIINLSKNKNEIKILLINTPDGTILPEGKWKITSNTENIIIDESIISKLDDSSRVFKYKGNYYAYIVTLSINNEKELYINIQFMMKNKNPRRIRPLFEAKKIKKKIKNVIQMVSLFIANIIYKFMTLIMFNKKRNVVFLSENADELIGNSLNFYNYLKQNKKYKVKKFCFNVFKNKLSYWGRLKELAILASCNYIIVDNYTPLLTYLNISKDVKIIQLWHAGVGFKAVGYARFGQKGSPHPFKSGHRKYDYAIVDNEELIEIYEEVFGIDKEKFIPAGMARLQDYLNENKIKKFITDFYKENNNMKNKKIILFAPTYRGTGQTKAYYDMEMINQDMLADFCKKNNFIVIFKFHPFINNNELQIEDEYKEFLFDYSKKYDINDLMYITDVLITDYSSCAYEYSLFDRPLIFYRYDKIMYEHTRKIHTKNLFTKENYEVLNFDELIKILNNVVDKPKFDIYENLEKNKRKDSCKLIEEIVFGEEK